MSGWLPAQGLFFRATANVARTVSCTSVLPTRNIHRHQRVAPCFPVLSLIVIAPRLNAG
jgi:hypothetical protein